MINAGVGKRRFPIVRMEKDMQIMIITITFLTLFRILTTVNLLLPTPVCMLSSDTYFKLRISIMLGIM